jgi:magnesium chelatase subunit D
MLAASLFALDPGTGGMSVRAMPGPVRDRYLAALRALLRGKLRNIPLHIGDDRLLGGIDLTATLKAGRPVAARGLLAEADGGVVLLAMAERVPAATAARLCATLDSGEVLAERDGMGLRSTAAIGLVALDEGVTEDERPAAALLDRLAFLVDLTSVSLGEAASYQGQAASIESARDALPLVTLPDDALAALCTAAAALGVASMRALLLSVRAARAAAALAGHKVVSVEDVSAAARLVLAPRATQFPAAMAPPGPSEEAAPDASDPARADAGDGTDDAASSGEREAADMVLAACKAAIPADLLAHLMAGTAVRQRNSASGGGGAVTPSMRRGRPIGARAGALRAGARLNLVETLRAAAPWQAIRRRAQPPGAAARVIVVPDDFRIVRFRQRTETTTIFLVDASGSAALGRLAEAKGAVELVLADCYVRRDKVALIAFRGTKAELILPPTGSLVRAKRCLAGLPGGGGTPLAAGLAAAAELAEAVRRRGQTPALILLSDGRANVARDGTAGRARAEADATDAARRMRAAALASIVVDTSPRPTPAARQLAGDMGARYLPLPYADADALSRAVRANAPA